MVDNEAANTERSKLTNFMETSISNARPSGSIALPASMLVGGGISFAGLELNQHLQSDETMTCTVNVPVDTKSIEISYKNCAIDTHYEDAVFLGGFVLGSVAAYSGWKYLVQRRIGMARYRQIRNTPFGVDVPKN